MHWRQRRRVRVKEVKVFTIVRIQNRKTVTLRLTIRRENAKLDKQNFKPKYRMVYDKHWWVVDINNTVIVGERVKKFVINMIN